MGYQAIGNTLNGERSVDLSVTIPITGKSKFDIEMERVALVSIAQAQRWDLISWQKTDEGIAVAKLRFDLFDEQET